MLFELKVALRFLREGRGQTVFILMGIAVGVAVQVFLNTLITGLQADLINQTVGSSHIFGFKENQSLIVRRSCSNGRALWRLSANVKTLLRYLH